MINYYNINELIFDAIRIFNWIRVTTEGVLSVILGTLVSGFVKIVGVDFRVVLMNVCVGTLVGTRGVLGVEQN